MSRRPGRGAQNDLNDSQAGADAEAAATTTAIAGLRWRLRRLSTLEHPAVRRELRKLEEQLAEQLERADRAPGRHRCTAGRVPGRPDAAGEDAEESCLRPDLATTRSSPAPALQLVPGT